MTGSKISVELDDDELEMIQDWYGFYHKRGRGGEADHELFCKLYDCIEELQGDSIIIEDKDNGK
jgi:hypothetical protein